MAPWIHLGGMAPSQPERGWSSWANQPSSLQSPIFTFTVCKSEKPFIGLDLKKRYRSLVLIFLQTKTKAALMPLYTKPNTF
jgi:hypothetical protein